MNCLTCGREMEQGFLCPAGDGLIDWSKQERSGGILRKKDSVRLLQHGAALSGVKLTAYICQACRKVMIEY